MLRELKESRSATCLKLESVCCTSATQDCEVFVEWETSPLETVPLTDELIQTQVLKGGRDFGTKGFVAWKKKGLVLATFKEFKELTELTTTLEGKTEGGTESALSLFVCDEIESVVTGEELTHTGSDE